MYVCMYMYDYVYMCVSMCVQYMFDFVVNQPPRDGEQGRTERRQENCAHTEI